MQLRRTSGLFEEKRIKFCIRYMKTLYLREHYGAFELYERKLQFDGALFRVHDTLGTHTARFCPYSILLYE